MATTNRTTLRTRVLTLATKVDTFNSRTFRQRLGLKKTDATRYNSLMKATYGLVNEGVLARVGRGEFRLAITTKQANQLLAA